MHVLAFTWPELGQQIVSGLSTGGVYAGLALAVVIIYRSTRVINFAQGEMSTFSTYIAFWLVSDVGWPFWGAFFATLAMSFAGGVLLERTLLRPVEDAPPLTVVIVTLGLLIALNGLTRWIFGGETQLFPSAFSTDPWRPGGVAISPQDVGTIGITFAAVAALWAFFRFTKFGLAMRGTAVNRAASRLLGVRVGWMLALGWGLSSALGALAGMLYAGSVHTFDPNLMLGITLYALAAAVLGGLESPLGAVVGGLVLGVLLNILSAYTSFFSGDMTLVGGLAVIVVVLLIRPSGVFGRTAARKV